MNIAEILGGCPEGTKLFSPMCGEVSFKEVKNEGTIVVTTSSGLTLCFYEDGRYFDYPDADCILFPSKDNRDWSTFKVEKPKFDPKTLQPFDRVLVRATVNNKWKVGLFSHLSDNGEFSCVGSYYYVCIPYNEETKRLVGTIDEAPEFYQV